MKAYKIALLAAVATSLVGGSAHAATATATVKAYIVPAISVTKDKDMDFGSFTAGDGGDVTLKTDSTLSLVSTNAAKPILKVASTPQAAEFTVTGMLDKAYKVTTAMASNAGVANEISRDPATAMAIDVAVATDSVAKTYTNFGSDDDDGAGVLNMLKDNGTGVGEDVFNVGGTLTIGFAQAPGQYGGIMTVTVVYE